MQRATSAYFQTQVATTSQGEVVIMLYDGAINFMNKAKEGLAAGDMAAKGIAISKTLDILNELGSSLNLDKGGALAKNLSSLYLFCTNHLAKANLKKDPAMIDEVIKIISGLRSAYAQIADMPEARAAAQEAADNLSQVSNRVSRPAGRVGAAPAPTPGAGARIRSLYAMHASHEAEPAPPHEAQSVREQAVPASAGEAEAAEEKTPGAPPAPHDPAPEGGFPLLPGFSRKAAGTDLYRKFSGQ